jgi:hypothetical protein
MMKNLRKNIGARKHRNIINPTIDGWELYNKYFSKVTTVKCAKRILETMALMRQYSIYR